MAFSLQDRLPPARDVSFAGVLLALAGLCTSPALLSLSLIIIGLPIFWAGPVKQQLKRFYANKAAFWMSMMVVLHLVSGLYA